MTEYVNLYLDTVSKDALRKEAATLHLSLSGYIRVLARFLAMNVGITEELSSVRGRLKEIIKKELEYENRFPY